MPRVGFEPTISAGERPKTYALDRASTGTGVFKLLMLVNVLLLRYLSICGENFVFKMLKMKLILICELWWCSLTVQHVHNECP